MVCYNWLIHHAITTVVDLDSDGSTYITMIEIYFILIWPIKTIVLMSKYHPSPTLYFITKCNTCISTSCSWRFSITCNFFYLFINFILVSSGMRMWLSWLTAWSFGCTWPHFPWTGSRISLSLSVSEFLLCFFLWFGHGPVGFCFNIYQLNSTVEIICCKNYKDILNMLQ